MASLEWILAGRATAFAGLPSLQLFSGSMVMALGRARFFYSCDLRGHTGAPPGVGDTSEIKRRILSCGASAYAGIRNFTYWGNSLF